MNSFYNIVTPFKQLNDGMTHNATHARHVCAAVRRALVAACTQTRSDVHIDVHVLFSIHIYVYINSVAVLAQALCKQT